MKSVILRDRIRSLYPELYDLFNYCEPAGVPRWMLSNAKKVKEKLGSERHSGLSVVEGTLTTTFYWLVQNNLTGSSYNPTSNSSTTTKRFSVGTVSANSASGGADEAFSFQQTILAGASATINLNAMQNLLQQSAVGIARIKGAQFRLLSATDDPTISPAPVATSTCTVTNNGPATPAQLYFGSKGSGLTLTLTTTPGPVTGVTIGAAGSGYPPSSTFIVAPNQAGGSGAVISVTTDGSGVPTTVAVVTGGAGYTNATVPSTELGSFSLNTGDSQMTADTSATGTLVSSTSNNIKVFNNDAANPITFQTSVFGATT